jgi:hypothetical protein
MKGAKCRESTTTVAAHPAAPAARKGEPLNTAVTAGGSVAFECAALDRKGTVFNIDRAASAHAAAAAICAVTTFHCELFDVSVPDRQVATGSDGEHAEVHAVREVLKP